MRISKNMNILSLHHSVNKLLLGNAVDFRSLLFQNVAEAVSEFMHSKRVGVNLESQIINNEYYL